MGCMECCVAGCDEILCKKYTYDHGYFCDHHLEELIVYLTIHGISNENIRKFIGGDFMSNYEDAKSYVMSLINTIRCD